MAAREQTGRRAHWTQHADEHYGLGLQILDNPGAVNAAVDRLP
ncbi:MAG: hypothetical protein WAL35_08775 [Acidimicrobiales bacterium]